MSAGEFNYLTLENGEDKKEPLIDEKNIHNDSTFLLQEDNSVKKSGTKEDINDFIHRNSSNNVSSYKEINLNIYKKQQNEVIKKLTLICVICSIFIIIEIVGGYLSNSIAIMSIAAYLLSYLLGLISSIISIYISRKIANNNMSFGYHVAEIIGALVSIVLIWSLTFWLLYETTLRIKVTPQVNGLIMIIIAIIGFCFNIIMGIILSKNGAQHNNSLHGQDKHNQGNEHSPAHEQITLQNENQHENGNTNVNLRVSFIHVLGDAIQNLGVLITGGIIFFFPKLSIADPVCSYFFSFIIVLLTIRILKDCIFILMEGNPVNIDIEQLEKDLKYIEGVKEINDLHVWRLSTGELYLSCHICCNDPEKTLKKAQKMVGKKYKIDGVNIQVKEKY